MSSHQAEHESLIQAVVVGDLSPGDEAVVRRVADCPECAALLAGTARATDLLEEQAREDLEIMQLAATLGQVPGEERITAFRQHPEFRRPGGRIGGRTGSRWRLRLVAASVAVAAALVIVFNAGPWSTRGVDVDPPPQALGGAVELLEPLGEVGEYGRFRWSVDPGIAADAVYFDLLIEGDDFEYRELDLESSEWGDPEKTAGFPDEIRWRVIAYDLMGSELGTSELVEARR